MTISKDGQFATLTFNQAEMSQAGAEQTSARHLPNAQQPSCSNHHLAYNARCIGLPTPTPHVRGVIQRNRKPNGAAARDAE